MLPELLVVDAVWPPDPENSALAFVDEGLYSLV